MPSEDALPGDIRLLARRQALELSDSRWDYDVAKLASAIEKTLADSSETGGKPANRRWFMVFVVGLALLAVVAWLSYSPTPKLDGIWDLPDGSYWTIEQNGKDLKINVVHHDTREVWQRGRGTIQGTSFHFHLDLVYQRGHSIEGQLTIGGDSKRITGEATGSPLGHREILVLQRR